MKFKIILLFILISSCRLLAQHDTLVPTSPPKYFIGTSGQYGFLWTHRYNMGHLVKKHLGSFEIDLCKTADGHKAWQQPYHFPWAGVALHVIPLGNPDQLGTAIGVYPFANFPLGKRDRNFKMHIRFGWGIGYITKAFDPLENHKNVAIGSHFNTCLSLRLNGVWRLNENNYMEFGLGMTHFSNGCMTLPNLGLNLPMVSVEYYFMAMQEKPKHYGLQDDQAMQGGSPATKRYYQIERIISDHSWHVELSLVSGLNDIDPPGGRRFGVLNFKGCVIKQTSRKSRWGFGADLMYSQAIRHKLVYADQPTTVIGAMQPGVKVYYEWVLGRVSFPIEVGYYLYTKYKLNGPVYSRFGSQYLFGRHLFFTADIKTHFARAEYFEFGAGWRF
jgi:hypothetical protein